MALAKFVEGVISRLKKTPVDFALIAKDGAQGSILNGARPWRSHYARPR